MIQASTVGTNATAASSAHHGKSKGKSHKGEDGERDGIASFDSLIKNKSKRDGHAEAKTEAAAKSAEQLASDLSTAEVEADAIDPMAVETAEPVVSESRIQLLATLPQSFQKHSAVTARNEAETGDAHKADKTRADKAADTQTAALEADDAEAALEPETFSAREAISLLEAPQKPGQHGEQKAAAVGAEAQQDTPSSATTAETGNDLSKVLEIVSGAGHAGAHVNQAADQLASSSTESSETRLAAISTLPEATTAKDDAALPAESLAPAKTTAKTDPMDSVTVLDARRFLGFSIDSNVNTLTQAIKSDVNLTQSLQQITQTDFFDRDTIKEVNTLKLQMNPEQLGSMVASLTLKGDELSVQVQVDTVEAYRQLNSDKDSIVQALQDQGFSIDQVSVQLSPAAREQSSQDSDLRGQNGQSGQNLREGQGDQSQNRENAARRQTQQNLGSTHDNAAGSTAQDRTSGSGSGNIYL